MGVESVGVESVGVESLSAELAKRRSRLWKLVDPHALAEWVHDPDESFEPLDALGGALEALDAARRQLSGELTAEPDRFYALGLAGALIRVAVPAAGRTAGEHWLLTIDDDDESGLLRLTVGVSEVLVVSWSPDHFAWNVRVAASPIDEAVRDGRLDPAELTRRGVGARQDSLRSFADDAVRYECSDIDAAFWLFTNPPVVTAARLMNARLAAHSFPHKRHYDAALAAEAWATAEVLLDSGTETHEVDTPPGFDRPYETGATPVCADNRLFDAAAYVAGVAEHDALCRLLIERLKVAGLAVGTHLKRIPVDLAWLDQHGSQFIAEVKSCNEVNRDAQLRLGLGQVIEYRQRLRTLGVHAQAILLVSGIADPAWAEICGSVDVLLLTADTTDAWAGPTTS